MASDAKPCPQCGAPLPDSGACEQCTTNANAVLPNIEDATKPEGTALRPAQITQETPPRSAIEDAPTPLIKDDEPTRKSPPAARARPVSGGADGPTAVLISPGRGTHATPPRGRAIPTRRQVAKELELQVPDMRPAAALNIVLLLVQGGSILLGLRDVALFSLPFKLATVALVFAGPKVAKLAFGATAGVGFGAGVAGALTLGLPLAKGVPLAVVVALPHIAQLVAVFPKKMVPKIVALVLGSGAAVGGMLWERALIPKPKVEIVRVALGPTWTVPDEPISIDAPEGLVFYKATPAELGLAPDPKTDGSSALFETANHELLGGIMFVPGENNGTPQELVQRRLKATKLDLADDLVPASQKETVVAWRYTAPGSSGWAAVVYIRRNLRALIFADGSQVAQQKHDEALMTGMIMAVKSGSASAR